MHPHYMHTHGRTHAHACRMRSFVENACLCTKPPPGTSNGSESCSLTHSLRSSTCTWSEHALKRAFCLSAPFGDHLDAPQSPPVIPGFMHLDHHYSIFACSPSCAVDSVAGLFHASISEGMHHS
eukprot:6206245-Pleurochrysis_carterae.AAC.3